MAIITLTTDFGSRDGYVGAMKGVLEDMELDSFEVIASRREVARINWKHAVDGGMEAYHVPFLHPTTFGTDGGGFLPHKQFGDHHAFITSSAMRFCSTMIG